MKTELDRIAKDTNLFLKKFLKQQNNSKLIPAMNYGLFPGGKKIRSKVLIDIGSLLSTDYKTLIAIGAAVECIHAYSLIHDDLPCMDNDKLRRGKPSTHIKFGESTAVLAGNSLLTMAFEILASPTLKISEKIKVNLIKKLSKIRNFGIEIALDDFGTGYSNLAYISKFPVNKIKIDMSFVRGIESNEKNQNIVKAIIDLSHGLKLTAIAEGVETAAESEFLATLGCDEMQGFWYHRPINSLDSGRLLTDEFRNLKI